MATSPDLRLISQQLPMLGYQVTEKEDGRLVAESMSHKVIIADLEGLIGVASLFAPVNTLQDTLLYLVLLANYGNMHTNVTTFVLNDDMDFVAYTHCIKPYEPLRFARILEQMRTDITRALQHEYARYLK